MNTGTAKKIRQIIVPVEKLTSLKEQNGGKRVSRGHFLRSTKQYAVVRSGKGAVIRLDDCPSTIINSIKEKYRGNIGHISLATGDRTVNSAPHIRNE